MAKKASSFSKRFIQAMDIRGLRQIDIANRSGLDKAQISQYKSGKNEPMQDALYKIAEVLNVNVSWLMGYDVPMEVDRTKLEQEVAICEIFEQCHGKEAYQMVQDFLKLDYDDRIRAHERILTMLDTEKYSGKKKRASDA